MTVDLQSPTPTSSGLRFTIPPATPPGSWDLHVLTDAGSTRTVRDALTVAPPPASAPAQLVHNGPPDPALAFTTSSAASTWTASDMTGFSLLSDSLGTTNNAPQVGRASAAEKWRVVDGDHAVVQSEIRQGAAGTYLRVSGAAGGRLIRPLESAETGPLRLVVKGRVRTGVLGVSAVRGDSTGPAIVLDPRPDVATYAVDVPGPADQVVIAVLADGTTADVHDISLQAAGVDGAPATNGQGQEMQAGATTDIAPADESTNGDATELPPVDVFRLMALRAPSSPTGTAPSIALEPPDSGEGEPSSRYVDEQGLLQDFAVYQGPDNVYLHMGALDAQLATRDDTWAPSDLEDWVQTTSAHR